MFVVHGEQKRGVEGLAGGAVVPVTGHEVVLEDQFGGSCLLCC